MSRKESVDVLRKKIDQIDEKVVALLNDRASLAQRIGQRKGLNNEQIYVPTREKQIYERVSRLSRGPLSAQAIRSIFREVVSASRSLEAPLKVVYLGPEATFTHLAAREKFGSSTALIPMGTIAEVFQEVSQGRVSFGVVPIENSTEGVVAHTLDLLVESDVGICAELFLDIHHYLLSRSGRAEDLQRIVSHPQALAQCRSWLATRFPSVKLDEVGSTAQAALMAVVDSSLGAISSSLAKEFYDLEVVEANIEDHGNNITRFLVIGRHSAPPTGDDKTSLVFSVKDRPGILHRMLQPFAKSRINLTKIESRPIKGKPWEYMFFIDFQGHREEAKTKSAMKKLEENCIFIKILGSYPSGA
ncbi:MAG TPA: prephenate dehydratase [Candidatus Binatia bacterium]|nr:prephenate dehydratase [Candidatus Binatia bacterium]